jgi:hypothetical protein
MDDAQQIFWRVAEEASAARGYFHTWWALSEAAVPDSDFLPAISRHADFFHACKTGFLRLTYVSLAKVFDRDTRSVGVKRLRKALMAEGYTAEAEAVESRLSPHKDLVKRIRGIRHMSVSHNQADLSPEEVFKAHPASPNEIRQLIDDVCDVMNMVAKALGSTNEISDASRHESAVMKLLTALERKKT